jgi:hypothetical protein
MLFIGALVTFVVIPKELSIRADAAVTASRT